MNIFLVEDEPWALTELVELFKRYEPQHTVHAFENGDDALAAAENVSPRLVVSDITMPGIDGLELIERLLAIDDTVKCIILSVHDQFEYARQGLKLGVVDYLLKPVKKEVLYQTVDQVIGTIEEEDRQQEERLTWSIKQMLLASPDLDEEQLPSVNGRRYCMAYCLYGNWAADKGWLDSGWTGDRMIARMTDETVRGDEMFCVDLDFRRRLLLIPANEPDLWNVESKLQALYHDVKRDHLVHFCHAVKREGESIREVFEYLHRQMEQHMKFGRSTWIPPDIRDEEADLTEVWDKVKRIEAYMQKGDLTRAGEWVDDIVAFLEQIAVTSRQLVLLASNMYYALSYKLQENKGAGMEIGEAEEDFRTLRTFTDFRQVAEWMKQMLAGLYDTYVPAEIAPKNLIPRVIRWIHHRYPEPLTFQQFANEHHVSLSYLSREFKAQTGCTFTEYLTRYRVEKAKELLAEGIERTGEVARLVGYEDPKHFRSLFKKFVGLSPQEYQKQSGENLSVRDPKA